MGSCWVCNRQSLNKIAIFGRREDRRAVGIGAESAFKYLNRFIPQRTWRASKWAKTPSGSPWPKEYTPNCLAGLQSSLCVVLKIFKNISMPGPTMCHALVGAWASAFFAYSKLGLCAAII